MKQPLAIVVAVVLLCGVPWAQQPAPSTGNIPEEEQSQPTGPQGTTSDQPTSAANPAATPGPNTPGIAPGSVIPVRLTKTLDAKKTRLGDPVEATITQDMKTNSGDVVLRKDAKVVGHVTEVQARNKEQKGSQVGIAFDQVSTTNGEAMQLPMSIQAVIAPPNQNPANEGTTSAPSSTPEPGGAPGARGGMGGGPPSTPSNAPQSGNNSPPDASTQRNPQQPITGNTQGVVGISNLTLSAAPDTTQGSLLSSEKNNVKLENGTFLLLRVNSGTVSSPQK